MQASEAVRVAEEEWAGETWRAMRGCLEETGSLPVCANGHLCRLSNACAFPPTHGVAIITILLLAPPFS
jgi:hypothetical protein